ncbi:MAG: gfo/Idh/MocA family oxidoreductase, partial [Bacteroidetes bacterium]
MSEKKWRFAITGLGSIAHFHIRSIRELPNCELAAVCSSSEERAAAVGKQYGVPWYTRHEHMLDEQPIDVLCICTISGRHLEPALAAARKGVHVLTEKPIEISLSRADEMIRACEKAGLQLGCIFQNRFREAYQHMKAAVEQGKIGRLVLGNAYVKWYRDDAYYQSSSWRGTLWGDGGAALINQAIHTIDLLQHLMGPVRGVIGKTATLRHAIEGEDLGLAILSFENGALGTIEGSTAIFP